MNDPIRELLDTLEAAPPPPGLRERIWSALMETQPLGRLQRIFYSHPLGAAWIISAAVTGMLWMLLGDRFPALMLGLFAGR